MKRTILRCAAGLLIAAALLPTALAAEPFPAVTEVQVCYPTSITRSEDGTEIRKVYDLSPEQDPAGIPRSDFEQDGFHYTLTDLLQQELPEHESRPHTETVSLESKSKDSAKISFARLQGLNPCPPCRLRAENQRPQAGEGVTMPKSYEICLRLSAEEKERLEHSARTCGLSKTAYLRRLILGKEVKALPSQEIKALRTEVHKIGVNINQIARSVNAGIAKAEDARRGLYLLEQVYELMYEVAKK